MSDPHRQVRWTHLELDTGRAGQHVDQHLEFDRLSKVDLERGECIHDLAEAAGQLTDGRDQLHTPCILTQHSHNYVLSNVLIQTMQLLTRM